jgi:hypothetical protein
VQTERVIHVRDRILAVNGLLLDGDGLFLTLFRPVVDGLLEGALQDLEDTMRVGVAERQSGSVGCS